jgi:four helix bundle protein
LKAKKLDIWKSLSKIYLYFYYFKDQITRSLLFVPSNIAEGVEKSSHKNTIKFLDIAKGTIAEVQTQIYIRIKIEYIKNNVCLKWIDEYEEISKMITSFINSIKKASK